MTVLAAAQTKERREIAQQDPNARRANSRRRLRFALATLPKLFPQGKYYWQSAVGKPVPLRFLAGIALGSLQNGLLAKSG